MTPEEIQNRLKGLNLKEAITELHSLEAGGDAVAVIPALTQKMEVQISKLMASGVDVLSALAEVLAENDLPGDYADTGEYDEAHEAQARSMMELFAFYDEAGPRSDPAGEYLCGTCCLRQGKKACLWVGGNISFMTGSCNGYIHGLVPLPISFELKTKLTQEDAGYAERPEKKKFGCLACEYSGAAKKPDSDGRKSWCRSWGVRIRKKACCMRHDGPDMITPGHETQ